jgi:hypothetical protein
MAVLSLLISMVTHGGFVLRFTRLAFGLRTARIVTYLPMRWQYRDLNNFHILVSGLIHCQLSADTASASPGLFLCSDFSGYELQGDEDQVASSSGRANHCATVLVPRVNPCL